MPSKKKLPMPKPAPERGSRGRTREGALFTAAPPKLSLPTGYAGTLQDIKDHLRSARVRAVLAANPIVIEAYWHTGKIILQRQSEAAWGAKVIDRLAADLREEFPDMGGLSPRNLLAMKIFAREFPEGPIAQQPVAQLPWGHVLQIMQRLKAPAAWYFEINLLFEKNRGAVLQGIYDIEHLTGLGDPKKRHVGICKLFDTGKDALSRLGQAVFEVDHLFAWSRSAASEFINPSAHCGNLRYVVQAA